LISYWSQYTLEQERIQRRLLKSDVKIFTQQILKEIHPQKVSLTGTVSRKPSEISVDAVVLVTDHLPNDELYQALKPTLNSRKLDSLRVIGDAEAPNIIAQAVFSGHLAAREFGETCLGETPFQREHIKI